MVYSAERGLGHDRQLALEPMLQGHPQGVTEKATKTRLDPRFLLMKLLVFFVQNQSRRLLHGVGLL
jgi:hypothetical protein